ncbi:MAG: hypothetical protein JWP59_2875, partial [Massilia sp.]|nr:hypothetical protein [Massilia sp.]
MLRADAEPHDARAVWLDARRIRWPGTPSAGVFKLYHAAGAGIDAHAGARVAGFDSALLLQIAPTPSEAPRFRYVPAGSELAADADDATLRQLHRGQLLLVREDEAGRV